jgi:DNA polymerase III delta subunit
LPYRAKKLLGQTRKFSWGELKGMFARFLEIDLLLKSTDIPGKTLLENFIWEFAD